MRSTESRRHVIEGEGKTRGYMEIAYGIQMKCAGNSRCALKSKEEKGKGKKSGSDKYYTFCLASFISNLS